MGRSPLPVVLSVSVVVVLVSASGVGGIAGARTADVRDGNGIAQVAFVPENVTVRPGETFSLTMTVNSQPVFASGLYVADVTVAFDPTFVRALDVSPAGYLEGGKETTVRTVERSIDNEAGTVRIARERDPPSGGVDGKGRLVNITFEVREDAPAGRFDVELAESELVLTDESVQRVISEPANVTVVRRTGTTSPGTTASPATTASPSTPATTELTGGTKETTDAGNGDGEGNGGAGPFGVGWPAVGLAVLAIVAFGAWALRRL